MKKKFTQVVAKIQDLGEGELEAIIATDDLDRHGEILDIAGVEVDKYLKNPVVLWAHKYDETPVAKAISLVKDGGKLVARMKFAIDIDEFAKKVYDLYKGLYLNAFSIGFIPLEENGNKYTRSEMLEFSAVPVPANANALALAKAKGIDTDILNYYTNGMKTLKDILKTEVDDLTVKEIKVLNDNISELSDEQKEKFASVLETKDDKSIVKEIGGMLSEMKSELKEELKKEFDPVIKKDVVNDKQVVTDSWKKKGIFEPTNDEERLTVSQNLFKMYLKGLVDHNMSEYREAVEKSAMNTDGDSALIPPTEFFTAVERLEEQYGVARRDAKTMRGNRASFTLLFGDDDMELYDTDEGGIKKSSKLSYSTVETLYRKMAGILPITDELLEDSAIDIWNDAVNRVARAIAKKEDYLVFMETVESGKKYKGICYASGTNVVTISGDSLADLDVDDLIDAQYGVPTPSEENGKWYMNRKVMPYILKLEDSQGDKIWQRAMADGTPATILGRPYELVEVMNGTDAADTPFIVFGNLQYTTLATRVELEMKYFDAGTVQDPDDEEEELNLITQDIQVLRARKRMNARIRFAKAFSVIKTGAAAS
jgi:HK97 family phage major capsid protein